MSPQADMYHGGALDIMKRQFPHAPLPWIDLSTGLNPWPWPVPERITKAQSLYSQLPTRADMSACRLAMSINFGADESHVLPVPGTAMAISLLPSVLKAENVCVLSSSYSDHLRAWQRSAAQVREHIDPLSAANEADVIALCNPNNPNGRMFERRDLLRACTALKARGGTLIVDEAYADLDPSESVAGAGRPDNLIVLRSMGKFYGLAGLRLGAVIANTEVLSRLAGLLGDWPVNALALKVGSMAYGDRAFQRDTRNQLAKARRRLDDILAAAGIAVAGGTDLFRFIEVSSSESLWRHLANAGIYVRRFNWSDTHIRVGLPACTHAESRLRNALMMWEGL